MNNERHFLQINSRKKIDKVINKQWIPISIALLALVSGGLIFNHPNASANTTSTIHTYKLINPDTILNDQNKQDSMNKTLPNNGYKHITTNINNLSDRIVHKNMQQGIIDPKSQNTSINENLNKLQPYQTVQYDGRIFSRVDTPFNKIRINRPIPLYNSLIFNKSHKVSHVTHGIFHILKAFNQYDYHNMFVGYLIDVHNHNYYITNNPDNVSFVLPSTNYRYYQNKINNMLATSHNDTSFDQINESLDSLNAQHVIDYKIYLSLYLDIYNLQQAEHPTYISHPIDKQRITVVPDNNAKTRGRNQDLLTSVILKKMHVINTNCQEAANYDNQSLQKINNITIPANAENNYLKGIVINEITINNGFIKDLINNTGKVLNHINNSISLRFEMNNLNLQEEMANNINTDAKQILSNDVRNLNSVY